jgi:hypothetical protein
MCVLPAHIHLILPLGRVTQKFFPFASTKRSVPDLSTVIELAVSMNSAATLATIKQMLWLSVGMLYGNGKYSFWLPAPTILPICNFHHV